MTCETLLIDGKDPITTITLNRPPSKNAMNPQTHFDMRDALDLIMTGKPIAGKQASEMRLVNSAVAREKLNEATLEFAEELKQKNPMVLAYAKEVFRVDQNLSLDDAFAWETAKWTELDAAAKNTWHKGVKQFKEERTYRPGLETCKWKG